MKINSVSTYSFKSQLNNNTDRVSISNPFLYTLAPPNPKKEISNNSFGLFVGISALAAVAITLFNVRKKNLVPESAVELLDPTKGLNKIKFSKTAEYLKKKFLYPIKATMEGDDKFLYSDKLKSGLILTSKSATEAKTATNALCEHAKAIGIYCMEIPPNLKRNCRIKWVYKALEEAQRYNKKSNNDFVLINIGNIGNLADQKIAKATNTKVEEKLRSINKHTYPGIIWTGWTDVPEAVPYFYNNAPVLITKLVD